jgi:CMP-N-acetylneuraminic acid synthetase
MRPSELATDLATGLSVWRHAVEQAELDMGTRYHLSVLLQPTSPFRRPDDVEACVELLVGSDFGLVTTVSPTPAHYSPEKTMVLDTSRRVEPYLTPSGFQPTRQLIPTYYHLNGICYAALREVILERDQLIGDDAGAVVIDRPMVNIDEPFDLELAGWLWERYGADAEGLT